MKPTSSFWRLATFWYFLFVTPLFLGGKFWVWRDGTKLVHWLVMIFPGQVTSVLVAPHVVLKLCSMCWSIRLKRPKVRRCHTCGLNIEIKHYWHRIKSNIHRLFAPHPPGPTKMTQDAKSRFSTTHNIKKKSCNKVFDMFFSHRQLSMIKVLCDFWGACG